MDKRLGTWNVRSLYRAGTLKTVFEGTSHILVRSSGSAGGRMGGRWHRTCGRIHIFLWKGKRESWIRYRFFFCITESYQQLRELSLLVIGCHT
jgi:hypothetical protein